MFKKALTAFISVALLSGCVTETLTSQKTFSPGSKHIALISPDVELSLLDAGGVTEPQAEWSIAARKNIETSLRKNFQKLNATLVIGKKDFSDDPTEVQLIKLHEVVGATVLAHQRLPNSQLPTKKEITQWSLGPQAAHLRDKYGADYALFLYVRDSYASAGRVAVIALAAVLGVGLQGGHQVGFASLVDLRTGKLIWFNSLARGSGDLRTPEAADETVATLLTNFPK